MVKRALTFRPADLVLTPELESWCEQTYPQIVPRETFERFCEWSDAEGVQARCWSSKFKRVVRTGIENKWTGIVVYRKGWAYEQAGRQLLHEARKAGFRDPHEHEPMSAYRTAFEIFKRQPGSKNGAVLPFDLSKVLKRG